MTLADARSCPGFVSDLLVRCGGGDDSALAALFELFHPVVSAIAVAETPDQEVTDVVLAAFTRVWRRAALFDPSASTGVAWMFREMATAVAERVTGGSRRSGPTLAAI
jgi:RNA polymerase sigma-70 factor (ECF subfamily)